MSEVPNELKELVIVRLKALPPDKKMSIGGHGSFSRDELIKHVKGGDKIGKKIVEIELEFLRALKKGGTLWQHTL